MTGAKSAMDLTILQAAQMLGKSPRQIRTMIQNGEITAARRGRMFLIDQATLPLSGGQAAAVERRVERAQEVVEEEVAHELDAGHPAAVALRKVLAHLGRGCHRDRGPDKAEPASSACSRPIGGMDAGVWARCGDDAVLGPTPSGRADAPPRG